MQIKLSSVAKSQSFTIALLAAVVAAILLPDLGAKGGPLRTEITTKVAVFLTFVIQGLSLPTRQILRSAANLKLHLFCQTCIFVLAPLLMFGWVLLFGSWIHPEIKNGLFYLAVLPTTISSAIVLTSNSEGDSSAALFSTTIANVLGIFITPFLCSLFFSIGTLEAGTSLASLMAKIASLILLPLIIGQALRPFVRGWAQSSKKLFKRLSNSFIVFIVYAAFCGSVQNGTWNEIGLGSLVWTISLTLLFLLLFSWVVWALSGITVKTPAERIAAFFCGSQKTLAAGVPMASILFGSTNPQALGLLILPLMCYHPLQLILAGIVSPGLKGYATKNN